MSNSFKLYAVKDTNTGKLVNNITNPRRKFWEKRGMCEKAIKNAYRYQYRGNLELVELLVTEVPKEICLDE